MPLDEEDKIEIAQWLCERGYKVHRGDHSDDLLACLWYEIKRDEEWAETLRLSRNETGR